MKEEIVAIKSILEDVRDKLTVLDPMLGAKVDPDGLACEISKVMILLDKIEKNPSSVAW